MFNENKNRSLLERIEGQKRGLRYLSVTIMETVMGPSTIESRNDALMLHAQAHTLYSHLERLERSVSNFNDQVDELLLEFFETHLLFNGQLGLLKMRNPGE